MGLKTFLEEHSLENRAEDTSARSLEHSQKGQQLDDTCPRGTAEMGLGKLKVCIWKTPSCRKIPRGFLSKEME